MRNLLRAHEGEVELRHTSVHKAKGREHRAVLLVLPRDRAPSTRTADVVEDWLAGSASEAKRVLCVGVTRAEQPCALAIPERLADRITEMLDTNDVTFTVENV